MGEGGSVLPPPLSTGLNPDPVVLIVLIVFVVRAESKIH